MVTMSRDFMVTDMDFMVVFSGLSQQECRNHGVGSVANWKIMKSRESHRD